MHADLYHRDVAQLVAHYVRDVGVGRSSRLIPTKSDNRLISVVAFSIPSLQLLENKRNILNTSFRFRFDNHLCSYRSKSHSETPNFAVFACLRTWYIFYFLQFICILQQLLLILHPSIEEMENLLSQNVRRICKEQKKQMKDLAADMGIDPASLTRALNGNARLDTVQKIATALGVSLKSLFEPLDDVEGYIRIGEQVYQFNSRTELNNILSEN